VHRKLRAAGLRVGEISGRSFLLEDIGNGMALVKTRNKSKLMVCSKLKHYIETKKLIIASKNLVSELKTFVARGTGYAAKDGETDDLVMAMILAVRMVMMLQEFDAAIDGEMRTAEEMIEPMPFIALFG
jgi:hypothetical protein